MNRIVTIFSLLIITSCSIELDNDISKDNFDNAQSFLDNIISNPEKAKSLLHEDFTFAWIGIIEQGGVIWNKENLFNEYFANIIPEILPNGIGLTTTDSVSDENGVAIVQVGDAEGKNGEYDNNYVWVFKFKDGLIIKHTYIFNLPKWVRQAMGLNGLIVGGFSFFKSKLNQHSNHLLEKYMNEKKLPR